MIDYITKLPISDLIGISVLLLSLLCAVGVVFYLAMNLIITGFCWYYLRVVDSGKHIICTYRSLGLEETLWAKYASHDEGLRMRMLTTCIRTLQKRPLSWFT